MYITVPIVWLADALLTFGRRHRTEVFENELQVRSFMRCSIAARGRNHSNGVALVSGHGQDVYEADRIGYILRDLKAATQELKALDIFDSIHLQLDKGACVLACCSVLNGVAQLTADG